MSKEAMKLALEKIATVNAMDYEYQAWAREALAKQEQGEPAPVAKNENGSIKWLIDDWPQNCLLYTHTTPQQRKPLTDEQRKDIAARWRDGNGTASEIIDMVEAAHGIKE